MTKKAFITRLIPSFSIFIHFPASAVKLELVSKSFTFDTSDKIYYSISSSEVLLLCCKF